MLLCSANICYTGRKIGMEAPYISNVALDEGVYKSIERFQYLLVKKYFFLIPCLLDGINRQPDKSCLLFVYVLCKLLFLEAKDWSTGRGKEIPLS